MIEVEKLSFNYPGEVPALRDLCVSIHQGERVAIIGPNGSGKSTFARCLNGLLLPSSGTVTIDNHSTTDPATIYDIRRRLSLVFQNPDDQLVSTTVESEIAFGLENLGVAQPEMVEQVEATIANFHLERYRHSPPHLLSGGEKQRLAIAACVALQPRYLVLDEPTALLDPVGRREILALLQGLHAQGVTPIHITQDPNEAVLADRVLVMNNGDVVMDGSPAAIFAQWSQLEPIGLGAPFPVSLAAALAARGVDLDLPNYPSMEDIECSLAALSSRTSGASGDSVKEVAQAETLTAQTPKLSIRDLNFSYETPSGAAAEALVEVNVDIGAKSAVAVIGPSGSGKTTLAQHLNGLLRPNRGHISLDGRDIWSFKDQSLVRSQVGLVFQFPELQLFAETLEEDVSFGPRNMGCDEPMTKRHVREALDLVGLPVDRYGSRSPLSLSGGERRRAAIAGVLAMQPQVLVLDEPTAGLDPHSALVLVNILTHLRESGRTLVLISHDMDLVAQLATHVVVMRDGGIVLSGSARDVMADRDFERLSSLEAPSSVSLMRELQRRGCSVPVDLISQDEVVAYFAARHGDPEEKD